MYTTCVFYNQIYVSLLPGRHSLYGIHFLIRQVQPFRPTGRPSQARPKTEASPARPLGITAGHSSPLIWENGAASNGEEA
jgi:hypothetical protein